MTTTTKKVSKTIYVGHLQFNTKEEDLKNIFSSFGEIETIILPTEAGSDRELGYALIEFSSEESANNAIEAMDGKEFNGRQLKVNIYKRTRCRGRW